MNVSNLVKGLLLSTLLAAAVNAQSADQSRSEASGLALEIIYYKNALPAYQSVPVANSKARGAWYARFGRIPGWQLPADQLPIRAVNILSRKEGDDVAISVSVLRGLRFHDQETTVGTYKLRESESTTITDLQQFGVEPFRIALVKVGLAIPPQPVVRSLAQSLDIIAVEPLNSTLPRFKLKLRNLSGKNISALSIGVFNDGKLEMSSMPHDKDGLPLIKAGDFYENDQPLLTRAEKSPGGFAPVSPVFQEVIITALVFYDGTYEGEPARAAAFRAILLGRKLALTRLLAVMAATDGTISSNHNVAMPALLRERVRTVSDAVDEEAFVQLLGEFPSLDQQNQSSLRSWAESGLHGVKKQTLESLDTFEKGDAARRDFQSWLANIADRYRNWLARL